MVVDLNVISTWVATANECELWSGGAATFPIAMDVGIIVGKHPKQETTPMSKRPLMTLIACASMAVFLAACSPEVGSKEWCAEMKEKPKGDWTASEAADFAKNCLI